MIVVDLPWIVKKLTYVAPARLSQSESTSERTVDISDGIIIVSPHERRTHTILDSIITEFDKNIVKMDEANDHDEQPDEERVGTDKAREAVGTTVDCRRHCWSE